MERKTTPKVIACTNAHVEAIDALRKEVLRDLDFEMQIGSMLLNATEPALTYIGFSKKQIKAMERYLEKQQELLKLLHTCISSVPYEKDL